jgi:hypothetical protein
MEQIFSDVARMLREALTAPPEVSRIQSDTGQTIEIERDSDPGIQVRLLVADAESRLGDWLAIAVRAVEERPACYPSFLPFVPGTNALITRDGEHVTVAWRSSEPPACAVPGLEPDEALKKLSERMLAIREEVRPGDPASRAEAREKIKSLVESLDANTRERLNQRGKAMRADPVALAELESIFDAAAEASKREGWEVLEYEEKDVPVRVRKTTLEHGRLSRTIFLMAMSGASVVLRQGPGDAESAA